MTKSVTLCKIIFSWKLKLLRQKEKQRNVTVNFVSSVVVTKMIKNLLLNLSHVPYIIRIETSAWKIIFLLSRRSESIIVFRRNHRVNINERRGCVDVSLRDEIINVHRRVIFHLCIFSCSPAIPDRRITET